MSVKLLALAASARSDSLNRRLLSFAILEAEAVGAEVTTIDYEQCTAPLYLGEPDAELPKNVTWLSEMLRAHDGLLLASPEYNWSVPGALKNLIDWLSVDPAAPLNGRTSLLMCATPSNRGGFSGLQHLRIPLESLGMWVYPQMIGIDNARTQLGETRLLRERDQLHMDYCVKDFVAATAALRRKSA